MKGNALDGVLVVALEQAVAAPLATSRLADAGARVIKLERPEGDFARSYDNYASGHSSYFTWLNRHKESCRVDLTRPDDLALVRSMLAKADVFIQNLGPGATSRLGLGSAVLRESYPRLVTCDISGYAPDTPDANRKAYDLMIQAEAGLANITGTDDSGPSRIGVSICDIATGMTAHAQIIEALYQREKTGLGRAIAVSLFDVAAEIMNIPFVAARNGGPHARRVGLAHPSIAPYGKYDLIDGSLLMAVQSEREWTNFCREVLNEPALAYHPDFCCNTARVANRQKMDTIISAALSKITTAQAIAKFELAKIAWGKVSTLDDLMSHTALSTGIATADDAEIVLVAHPAIVDGKRAAGGEVPSLGEHDILIREEFVVG